MYTRLPAEQLRAMRRLREAADRKETTIERLRAQMRAMGIEPTEMRLVFAAAAGVAWTPISFSKYR
jgi:hypothetical protein